MTACCDRFPVNICAPLPGRGPARCIGMLSLLTGMAITTILAGVTLVARQVQAAPGAPAEADSPPEIIAGQARTPPTARPTWPTPACHR